MELTPVEWLQVQIKNCPTAENLMNNIDGFLKEAKLIEKNKALSQHDVSGLLPSLEEFDEQKERYLKQNGYDTIGNAQKIWQDAANWVLNYVAKKAKGNSH